jgi:hypothetical protein
MSNTVKLKRVKIKQQSQIDFEKRDPRLLSITDSRVKSGKSIQIDKATFAEFDKTPDGSTNIKTGISAEAFIVGSNQQSLKIEYRKELPFELVKDSTGVDFQSTNPGMTIANNHIDDESMQGPFVKEHVGGFLHRRNKFNNTSTRTEAYKIEENTTGLLITQTNNMPQNYRRAAGSPCYNFANIKGANYDSSYEIVLTSGRLHNNRELIISGSSLSNRLAVVSNYVSGFVNFNNPQRSADSHVIAQRFSTPAGFESSVPVALDYLAEEYSVYNTVNYRNRTVRDTLDWLSSQVTKKFGIYPGTSDVGSYHKTHRNTYRFIDASGNQSRGDNFFINHSIPSNDYGYLWVSKSAEDSVYDFLLKNSNFGHQHLNANYSNSNVDSARTINFLSKSLATDDSRITFSSLNFITKNEITDLENLKFYTSGNLRQQLINTSGPYGWPSWKQIRNYENPIVRKQRMTNNFSVVFRGSSANVRSYPGVNYDYQNTLENNTTQVSGRTLSYYQEPAATQRYSPLKASLHFFDNIAPGQIVLDKKIPDMFPQDVLQKVWEEKVPFHTIMRQGTADNYELDTTSVSMIASVQSNLSSFANEELKIDLQHIEPEFLQDENLMKLNYFFTDSAADSDSDVVKQLTYTEVIYPKEMNHHRNVSISRPKFYFFGWDSQRGNRAISMGDNLNYSDPIINNEDQKVFITSSPKEKELDFKKSFFDSYEKIDLNATGTAANILSSSVITTSTWVLDSRVNFGATPVDIASSYFTQQNTFLGNRDQGSRGEGILQNDFSIFPLGYNGLRGAPPIAPVYNRRIPQIYGDKSYLAGESLWEAPAPEDLGPFYNKYENFAKDIKYLSRGHSLVPEFRMSSFVEDIYASQDFEKASTPENFLELTGTMFGVSNDSSNNDKFFKTFSNSEFMKYFKPLYENLKQESIGLKPGRLTLRCQANLKLLPYRGFYPAERAVQISEIFNRNYFHENSYLANYVENDALTNDQANKYLDLRIQNAKAQAIKPLFSPGILFNSIKSGLAVDYPIFSSSVDPALTYILENNVTTSITSHSSLGLSSTTTCFTGSEVNSTVDAGVPRIQGQISRRISFEDLLEPERIVGEIVYDNEPHPSASLLYGSAEWIRVLPRPTVFGELNTKEVKEKNAIDFSITKESFVNSMRPYKSAINNFTAETVKFFLKDEKLQTHTSDAVEPYLSSGTNYKMRVYVNNQDVVMYDRHSAFGPPVDDGHVSITTFVTQSSLNLGTLSTGQVNFTGLSKTSINASTLRLIDYDNKIRDYKFINGYSQAPLAATAQITFNLAASSLNQSTITIQSAVDKYSITYFFTTDSGLGKSTGQTYKGTTVVFLTSSMNAAACAAEFATALASSNGHGSKISASHNSSSGVTTLTQATAGKTGNRTMVGSGKFSQSSGRISGFSGGSSGVIFSTGQLSGSSHVVIQVETSSTVPALAQALNTAVSSYNGHSGSISSYVDGNLLRLSQTIPGTLGNRTITGTGQMTGGAISGFSGGTDSSGISFLTASTAIQSGSHGFLPFVPPYLDPGTRPYAEISFTPSSSKNYSIPDIIENCSISYHNFDAPTDATNNTNYLNSMSLSASIDLKRYVSLYSDNFTYEEDGSKSAKKESKKYRWVIQPKWETPIMDFSDAEVSALNLSNSTVEKVSGSPWKQRNLSNYYELLNKPVTSYLTASTGMWHQSGTLISQGALKGYYLTIESGEDKPNSNQGDLATELGFVNNALRSNQDSSARPLNSKKLGLFSKEKEISESIVAIPYYLNESDKIRLFDLNSNEFAKARSYNNRIKNNFSFNLQNAKTKEELLEIEKDYKDWSESVGHDSVSSIAYQLRMMEKYMLPPHFDFTKNKKVNPHVIYFFQFKGLLTEKDLSKIWQNIYPNSQTGAGTLKKSKISKNREQTDTQFVTGFLDTSVFPEDLNIKSNYQNYETFLENNVRWLVFKVKFRASNDLSKVKNNSIPKFDDDLESVNGILLEQPLATTVVEKTDEELFSKYSYNWPYDYFSLIENIKLESKVSFYSPLSKSDPEPAEPEQPITSRVEESIEMTTQAAAQIILTEEGDNIDPLSNLVIRQEVKNDATSAPSPANVFNIIVDPGYKIKINSESIYVNGNLQVAGSSMDYTLSGNTISFTYDIKNDDSIYVTYIRE